MDCMNLEKEMKWSAILKLAIENINFTEGEELLVALKINQQEV